MSPPGRPQSRRSLPCTTPASRRTGVSWHAAVASPMARLPMPASHAELAGDVHGCTCSGPEPCHRFAHTP